MDTRMFMLGQRKQFKIKLLKAFNILQNGSFVDK